MNTALITSPSTSPRRTRAAIALAVGLGAATLGTATFGALDLSTGTGTATGAASAVFERPTGAITSVIPAGADAVADAPVVPVLQRSLRSERVTCTFARFGEIVRC
ncbi:MAG: hypothetical protein R2705_13825 [Ilumatobacteraceae bacterium]